MSPEQDLQTELDKSIGPNVLVVQQGEDVGRIAAAEHIDAKQVYIPTTDGMAGGEYIPPAQTIGGLPVIGAEAENAARNSTGFFSDNKETNEQFADTAGIEAMVTEVGRRARDMVPNASENLKEALRIAAENNFRSELETKKNEKQAVADAEAQALIDRLMSGVRTSEIIPGIDELSVKAPQTPQSL